MQDDVIWDNLVIFYSEMDMNVIQHALSKELDQMAWS